ncbi:MAG TPA: GGDEF domain-containing protein [Kineosporiaceae bacterium]|nr:GGDEF domain-containing protein [Kineosporiaceae bacterium]
MNVAPGRMRKTVTGTIVEVDDLVLGVLGFTREDMLGHLSTEFLHPDDHGQAFSSWVRMLADPAVPRTIQVRHRNAAHRWLWIEATSTVDDADSGSVITELTLIDRPPDDRTSVSSSLFRHLAEALPFGLAQIDRDRRIVFSNTKLDDITGQAHGDDLSDRLGQVLPAEQPVLDEAITSALAGDDTEIELSLTHPVRGERRFALIISALADHSGYGMTGALLCVTDITDTAQQRADIIHRAEHDGLTKCLNRAAILDALTNAIAKCTTGVAVIFFDLDHFKHINDVYGHAAGDRLLVTVGERLRNNSRDASVGRLGGDEFLVIACDVPTAELAETLGRRLARAVRRPANVDGTPIRPAASVGVAWSADPTADPAALVAGADAAMYEAKRRRKPRPATDRQT